MNFNDRADKNKLISGQWTKTDCIKIELQMTTGRLPPMLRWLREEVERGTKMRMTERTSHNDDRLHEAAQSRSAGGRSKNRSISHSRRPRSSSTSWTRQPESVRLSPGRLRRRWRRRHADTVSERVQQKSSAERQTRSGCEGAQTTKIGAFQQHSNVTAATSWPGGDHRQRCRCYHGTYFGPLLLSELLHCITINDIILYYDVLSFYV